MFKCIYDFVLGCMHSHPGRPVGCRFNTPAPQKVAGSFLDRGPCLGCKFSPQLGCIGEATDWFFSSSLLSKNTKSINQISMSSGEEFLKIRAIVIALSNNIEPWLVWLSGLSAGLQTKQSLVWFPVRAHAWVAGQMPSGGAHNRQWHADCSLPLFL